MVTVIKATGEKEPFSEEKLRHSIQRAGIPLDLQDAVVEHVTARVYENIPTSEIYHHITEFLTQKNPYIRAKFSLKKAIMELGPTGYPFEDFVAKVLETQGYKTQTRTILEGKCITHEIDIIAEKDNERIAIEAKYHNMPGTKTNVHVALYTKARFDDIKDINHMTQAWLVTNTKITLDAVTYAECSGMKVISWNYPDGGSLRDLIEKSGLTPITALTTLSDHQKKLLIENGVVLSKDLCDNPSALTLLNLNSQAKDELFSEIQFACSIKK